MRDFCDMIENYSINGSMGFQITQIALIGWRSLPMTIVRVRGLKRYRSKGKWYAYHRKSGRRLSAEFGTPEFFVELNSIESNSRARAILPGTLGQLFTYYRNSAAYSDLAAASKVGYDRMINLIEPLREMPLAELTPQFVANLRDRIASRNGRRQATT